MRDYHLIKFVIAFALGLIITSFLEISLSTQFIFLGVLTSFSVLLFLIKKNVTKLIASYVILISVSIVGMISITVSQLDKQEYPFEELFVKDALIDGRIEEIDLPSKKLTLKIKVEQTLKNKSIVSRQYNVLCNLNYEQNVIDDILRKLRPGNRVVILGSLQIPPNQRNPGEFDYRKYLRGKDIPAVFNSYDPMNFVIIDYKENIVKTKIFETRYTIAKQIKEIYNDRTAGLLKGLLLADRSEIGYDVKEGFIKSGVIHVLAVSGLHVGFIVLILLFLLGRFNIYLRISFTVFGLIAFMIITGMPPSVTRATIMAILLLISYIRSNKQNNFNTLALAAFLILIIDPSQIFNPGFQLSFSAVISIFIFFPRLRNFIDGYFKVHSLIRGLLLFLSVSLAAQLGTLPFTIFYFGKLSLISLFANIVIIPLIGFIIGVGIFTLFVSTLSTTLSYLFVLSNQFLVDFAYGFVKSVSSISFSYLEIPNYTVWDGAVYLFLLLIFTTYFKKLISYRTKILFGLLIVSNLLIWSKIDNEDLLPEGKLSVMFLDIGQSESALVKFPDSKTAMINFGAATNNYSAGKYTILPLIKRLGIEKINYAIVSHLDRDKYLGVLELIEDGKVDTLFIPRVYGKDIEAKLFEKYLHEIDIAIKVIDKEKIELPSERMYFLSPLFNSKYDYFNILNRSAPIKLTYGKTSFLFPGGIEKRGEEILVRSYDNFLQSNVLQLANFGSTVSTSQEFLKKVDPNYSIVSVGLGNYLEFPSSEVLERVSKENISILRTDKDGAILFISDGKNVDYVDWRND